MLLAIWALLFAYAFLRRDRMLQLMAFWVVITPLPLAFISPRGGARLYILLFGWAMIFAKLASDVITLISKPSALLGQGGAVGAATRAIVVGAATSRVRWAAIRAAAGAVVGKTSPVMFRAFAMVLVAFALALFTRWENQRFGRIRALLNSHQKTLHVIQAFRSLNLHPAPGSLILLRPEKHFQQNGYFLASFASLARANSRTFASILGLRRFTRLGGPFAANTNRGSASSTHRGADCKNELHHFVR